MIKRLKDTHYHVYGQLGSATLHYFIWSFLIDVPEMIRHVRLIPVDKDSKRYDSLPGKSSHG